MKSLKIILSSIALIASMQVFAEQAFSNQLLTQAQNGDTTAQLDLAEAYLYGNGIQRDTEQAEVWGIKSAENGNPKAMFWLAEGYTFYALFNQKNDKKDVLDNYQKAFKWYSKASALKHTDSMVELANLYTLKESGVEQNINKAFQLRQEAATLGNKQAMQDLALMYKKGVGVKQNKRLAQSWLNKSKK